MDRMNRRDFLQSGTAGAAALAVGAASSMPALATLPSLTTLPSATGVPVLFDGRFPAARAHARKLAGAQPTPTMSGDAARLIQSATGDAAGLLKPVPADATELMQAFASGRGPRRLFGVTTESVPFCLTELAPRDKRPRLTLRRLDQDLFAWHLVHTS